jgi:hypothetical protein
MTAFAVLRTIGSVGFLVTGIWAFSLLIRLIDERKGRTISAARVLLFPFFISRADLTERGQHLYAQFGRVYAALFVCWLLIALTVIAAH